MDTSVEGGVVQPRFYIPYGDEIRSKYAMEAIAIPHGIGPVIGFDRVSVSTNGFTITGTNVEIGNGDSTYISDAAIAELKKRIYSAGGFRTCYISRDNLSGRVVNSHITPDGMLFIDPTTLEFTDNEFKIDPSTLGNGSNNFLVALKATHTWVGSKEETPQMSTFTIKRFGFTRKLKELLRMPFPQVLKMLADNGFGIDNNTEVLVGLYLFGTASEDNDPHVTSLMEAVGYILPIIPYTYEWPAKFNYSLGTELTLYEYMDAKVAKFTELTDGLYQRVTGVENKSPIQKNDGSIANGALTPNLLEANFDLPNGTTATTQPSSATQGNLVATLDYVKGAVGNIVFPEPPEVKIPWPYSDGWVKVMGSINFRRSPEHRDTFTNVGHSIRSDTSLPWVNFILERFSNLTIRVKQNKLYGSHIAYEAITGSLFSNIKFEGKVLKILLNSIRCNAISNGYGVLYGKPTTSIASGPFISRGYVPISACLSLNLTNPHTGSQNIGLNFLVSWPPVNGETSENNCLELFVELTYSFFWKIE